MRTREQVIADCEAAYEALKREAEKPERKMPCKTCLHHTHSVYTRCHHPLIKGFGKAPFVDVHDGSFDLNAELCGPERGLWEPMPRNWFIRFIDWLLHPRNRFRCTGE